ncbi:hypothetical protein LCGC14_1339180 [marine sediment metagenome]|uniref:Uncharacterized protein n=1 Tax=marine sediment metagenome TaxID=412755 RepID=A0A0F9MV39_9ZZZZ|nr:hypothetical protein [bacterium]
MSPTCQVDELEARAVRCSSVEDELNELKQWVQGLSNELDFFVEEIEGDPYETSRSIFMGFIKEIQAKLEKKKNEVMGYDNAKN